MLKYHSLIKFREPPIIQGRIHGAKLPLSGLGHNFRLECTNMAKYAKYAYLGAYLGARNMVKWGVPEKSFQNAVQKCVFQVASALQSKVMAQT